MSPRAVFWNLVMFSFPFLPPFDICRELAISQGITFSFFSEISLKNEKIKTLSLVKLPIPCGYRKGEGRGRETSQGFRKRPLGTCRPFQNGRLLIFCFLKFFTSVWYILNISFWKQNSLRTNPNSSIFTWIETKSVIGLGNCLSMSKFFIGYFFSHFRSFNRVINSV